MTAFSRTRLIWSALFALMAAFLFGALAGVLLTGPSKARFDFLYNDFTIESCLEHRRELSGIVAPPSRSDILHCYNLLAYQGQLNEFQIRRVNFQNQHVADNVVMWMVVVLTLSGVALAGFQIVASTALNRSDGSAPPDSELSVERGKLFLRSSVTGLFILLISFAFFYTYVVFVYRISDIGDALEAEEVAEQPAAQAATVPLPQEPDGMLIEEPEGSLVTPPSGAVQ